ncbi:retrotransposon nucleocapsid protein [Lasallia pustulata]|uniref:Retrotransposon nucleocapsid protein n=1 Tax=Lasallia pustulata TaxID=136370 RepID=A0A1W5D5D4_9LECA|nr:retrotransposon nucleocapsid protein [Lasallia pustulata]
MSLEELRVLRKWLDDNLAKGFICASSLPAALPVLFAQKPGGGLCFCVDYRGLNAITIKNQYAMPLIQETLSRLSNAKYYTKLDIIAAFNTIRIKEGQEWLTAFNTHYGLFETLVIPFRLSNAPATFQARINDILRLYLDIFCTAYIDDILIYSDDLQSHRGHVYAVLQALREAGLHCDLKKCKFEVTEVVYLGMIMSTSGVRMDPKKVKCIVDWQTPSNLKDVQAFLGFSNFYRQFIKSFPRIAKPLVALTKKDAKFQWTDNCSQAFKCLKKSFIITPILKHYNPKKQTIIEADASDYVSSSILSQYDDEGTLHPVAFMSEKYNSAECNYKIYDKELLAIVHCLERWRSELTRIDHPVAVLTDHHNLLYFMSTKQLTQREVRWSEFLSGFDYIIKSTPEKANGKADALTRRSQDLPSGTDDDTVKFRQQTLLKSSSIDDSIYKELNIEFPNLMLSSATIEEPIEEHLDHKIIRLMDDGYKSDKFWLKIKAEMIKETGYSFKGVYTSLIQSSKFCFYR